jgi:hypothetical protein
LFQEDYLLSMIENMAKAVARLAGAEAESDDDEADAAINDAGEALQAACGLGPDAMDSMPAQTLVSILTASDRHLEERLDGVAFWLHAMALRAQAAGNEDLARTRWEKSQAIRAYQAGR